MGMPRLWTAVLSSTVVLQRLLEKTPVLAVLPFGGLVLLELLHGLAGRHNEKNEDI